MVYRTGTLDHSLYPVVEAWYSLGVAVLTEHLKAAAKYYLEGTRRLDPHKDKSDNYHRTSYNGKLRESYAFVTGTGIELIVESYGLEVDATLFKENFFEWIDWQRRMGQSKSSLSSRIM